MQVSKITVILILSLACVSCIEPFDPDLHETQDLMVISGVITDAPGLHYVTISRSVAFDEPWNLKYVSGCEVSVMDNFEEVRSYNEVSPGLYEVLLDRSYLQINKTYQLIVESPLGSIYKSEPDTLLACPPVESLYFEESVKRYHFEGFTYPGIQFYNDVIPQENGARSFRWVLNETWEYKVPYVANMLVDHGDSRSFDGRGLSTCYKMEKIESLYSATIRNQLDTELRRNPLNFVPNRNQKLSIKYSLLVEQHSLTNTAFDYWSRLQSSINDTVSLYETQPLNISGNIYNESNPDEQVLGLFYASQIQEERIMVENGFSFEVAGPRCEIIEYPHVDSIPEQGLFYVNFIPGDYLDRYQTGPPGCFNCMESGGLLEKPDYW